MANKRIRIRDVLAKLFFATLLLWSAVVTPAHAVSMSLADIGAEKQVMAVPCPMSGMMMAGHGDADGPVPDEPPGISHICCPAPALDSAARQVAPVRLMVPATTELANEPGGAVSAPGVALQPPRG